MRVKEKSIKAGLKLHIQKTKIMASRPITSWQIEGEKNANWQISFCSAPKPLQMVTVHEIQRCLLLEGKLWQTRQNIKNQRHHFASEGPYSQSYGFSIGHVWMWELDYRGWALKNWWFWIVEKMLENPLGCKEIKSINP